MNALIAKHEQRQNTQGERLGEVIQDVKACVRKDDFEELIIRIGRIEKTIFIVILFLVAIFGKEYIPLFSKL